MYLFLLVANLASSFIRSLRLLNTSQFVSTFVMLTVHDHLATQWVTHLSTSDIAEIPVLLG